MNQYKVIIAEDHGPSREVLKHFMKGLTEYEICGEASNGEELIGQAIIHQPDLLLLDIHMPGLNGIDAIKKIMQIVPPIKFIFITGYDEFAVEAFNLAAVDYIVKPVERDRLLTALHKFTVTSLIGTGEPKDPITVSKLVLRHRGSRHYINFSDIIFIEKAGRKAMIHTAEDVYESGETLESLLKKLNHTFLLTHRSYIINLEWIAHITAVDETYRVSFKKYPLKAMISKHKIAQTQLALQQHLN
ncbi:LytR/AlgR family response regulator transcription factor [Fictibacillus iocasae]|uniref:LytR/AlgR family response regulator transcription factor n=1 Tax=Fictibacillus iocasae TaxID=2715437 RepID=A0ABW2NT06_9BACL